MIYNKLNLSITDFCGDESHPEISGVLFTKDKTVATNSHILIEVKNPKIDKDDFPILPDVEIEEMKEEFVIPVKAVKKMNSNIPKNNTLPILENVIYCNSKKNEEITTVEFASSDLEQVDKVGTRAIIGKYPDYQKVIPKGIPKNTIKFDPQYLKKICEFWIKNGNRSMEFKIYNDDEPIIIEDKFNNQDVKAAIMPIRKD